MVYATRDYMQGVSSGVIVSDMIREVVGVFMSIEDLQECIRDLEGSAFPRQDISVMGSRSELEDVFGAKTVRPDFAMDNADTPRQAPLRPEEQTIGTAGMIGGTAYVGAMALALAAGAVSFPAIISAAVIGGIGGGTLGAILSRVMGKRYDRHMREQIEKGGLLLWVRTPDMERQSLAKRIMVNRNGYHVHTHKIL